MDYFATPPVDYFAAPVNENNTPVEPVTDPEVAHRTAQVAALADLNPSEEAGSIFAAMASRTQGYQDQIEKLGDADIRTAAAERARTQREEQLTHVLQDALPHGDEALIQGSVAAYTNVRALDIQEEARYAMERQAVQNIQNLAAQGDMTQARLMLSNLENGNALDVIRDMNAKRLILSRMIDRAQVAKEDQGWLRNVADFAMSVVPLYGPSHTGNVPVEDTVRHWYDSIFSGQRFEAEADSLWDMPLSEFSKFVNEDFLKNLHENATLLGYTNNTEQLELLSGLAERTPGAFETNAWAALDVAGAIPFEKIAGVGRGAFSMLNTMARAGARREASELTAKAALDMLTEGATRAGLDTAEIREGLSVSATADAGTGARVPLGADASAAYDRGRALLDMLPELETRARLDATELAHARDVLTERLSRQFGRDVKDVAVHDVDLAAGRRAHQVEVTMGRKTGGGFAGEVQANRLLGDLGLPGEAIVDESGQWFARARIDIPETGFFTRMLNVRSPTPARFVLNARNVGDTLLGDAAQVAGNARNKLLRTIVEPYSDVFRALRGEEKDALAQVLQAGETNAKWFDMDQLDTLYQRRFNRSPSAREITAYNAARDINDIEYTLRNDDIYLQRATRGYKTVSFDTGMGPVERANAIVDRELKEIPRQRLYDASARRHYTERLTEKQWARLKSQGYTLVTLEHAMSLADGTRIKSFLVKGKDAVIDNLKRDQLAYRAGGHRMYKGKYFVKQAVRGIQPDTGAAFLDNPNTYIAAQTRAEATFWASRMEAARLAHVAGEGLDVIDNILGGHPGLPDAEEFVRNIVDPAHPFQRDTAFDVFYDREMPKEYLSDGAALDFVDPDEGGFNGFLRTQGRMYTGRKGEQLTDYMGNLAPLIDPYETINKSLMNIASLTSFGDYKIQAVERWMKTFRSVLDIRDLPDGASNMRVFMEAPFVKGGNAGVERAVTAAKAQRAIIKRTLGWKTPNDLAQDAFSRRMMDFVAGDQVDGILPNLRRGAVDWVQEKNPISALRGFAFDLKLGLFNFAQLPLQLSTAVAAVALSPKNGMRGWAMIAPMRFVLGGRQLTREAFESRLDLLIKNGVHGLGGFNDPKEFKEFARSSLRSGFFDLGGTHALVDNYGASASLDGFQSGVKRVREAGQFFFFEAERWNRIVAWRIAWGEAREKGLKIGSTEFAQHLAGRGDDYSLNMSRESQAWWQKGIMSIPTQFWAYNARMIEAMTVGQFTKAQKARLIVSQTLLYGSAGLPVTGFISQMLKQKDPSLIQEGGALDLNADPTKSPLAVLDRGILDQAMLSFTGADVSVGQRYGSGNWAVETVRNLFGAGQYGEMSAAEMLGGATYNIMGKVGQDIIRPIMEYVTAESGDQSIPMTADSLNRVASSVSLYSNLMKAYLVYNYGTYRSASGFTTANNLPSQDALAIAFGIPPQEAADASILSAHFKDKTKIVNEAARVINNYRTDLLNRPDQRETIQEDINAFTRMLAPDVRAAALRKANNTVDPSFYASLTDRLEREQAEQDGLSN